MATPAEVIESTAPPAAAAAAPGGEVGSLYPALETLPLDDTDGETAGSPTSPTTEQPHPGSPQLQPAESTDDADDALGLKTVQEGLWGLWNSVAGSEMLQTAVKKVEETATDAAQAVTSKGLVQATKDADAKFLSGTLTGIINTTRQVAREGITMVQTRLPVPSLEANVGSEYSFVLGSAALPKVNAVREAIDQTMGPGARLRAFPAPSGIAEQPVGVDAGRTGALNRLQGIEATVGDTEEIRIGIESYIFEVEGICYDAGYLILRDPVRDIQLECITQTVPVPAAAFVAAVMETPADYEHSSTGLKVTVGSRIHAENPDINPQEWHQTVCGLSRESLLRVGVLGLLGQLRFKVREAEAAAVGDASQEP